MEDAEEEDGKLLRGGNRDALAEDGGGVAGDAIEEAMVDADEDAHGGAGVGVEEGDELGGAAVEGLSVEFEAAEESEFVGLERRAGGQGEDAFGGYGVLAEEVGRQVDAAAVGVFLDVAKDVGQLEGDAGVDGEWVRTAVGVAEDPDADETDDRGYEVAVVLQRGEAIVDLEGARRPVGTGDFESVDTFGLRLQVEGGAGNELLKEVVGDGEALLGVVEGEEDGVGGGSGSGGAPGRGPGGHGLTAGVEGEGLVVG